MLGSENIVEITVENFQAEVGEKSNQVPVVLEFYAENAGPSVEMSGLLKKLVESYQGKFVLARVNVQTNPQIAQQLQVRGLPTLKVISKGQLAESLEGPQDEASLRTLLDQLTMSPMEQIRGQLDVFLSEGDRVNAISLLEKIIAEEPGNLSLQTELCDLLIMEDRVTEAKQILAGLPVDAAGINKPKTRLEFMQDVSELPGLDELKSKLELEPDVLEHLFAYAQALVADNQMELALETLLSILRQDKTWQDEAARKTMIKVFVLLGKGNELATTYRRKMFTLLH
jgi:putative thioredoxin